MNFLEILKSNNLSDDAIVKINAEMKANKIFLASEENLDVRYNKLKMESENNNQELAKSQALIQELQKGSKGNEELQAKIKGYEDEVATLKANIEKQRVDSALDRALIEANVQDVDYVKFKLKEKGTELKLDENGKLTNIQDTLDALKVQIPNQFKSTDKKIEENKLPNDTKDKTLSKEDFSKMNYHERAKLFKENPEQYKELNNNKE